MNRITNGTKALWRNLNAVNSALYEHYANLTPKIRNSALPYILASLPIVIMSITGSIIVMPLVILMSVVLIFYIAQDMDQMIFSFTKQQARKAITIPLTAFICAWGITLVLLSEGRMMNSVVGPYCGVLLVACAPAYRWNINTAKRRVPLALSLSLTGLVAVAASFFHVNN